MTLKETGCLTGHPCRDYVETMATQTEIREAAGGMVVSNPDILGGTPVFRGTRMPIKTLFDYVADGLTLDYFLETFPSVAREQAAAVLRYGLHQIETELAG